MTKYYLPVFIVFILICGCISPPEVRITEKEYLGLSHFKVTTPGAVYYYDKAGGGLSSMIDADGRDWISFSMDPWHTYPESAAGWYRGLPNFVHGSQNSGAGHPGFERCESTMTGENTILSRSIDAKWKWEFSFFDDHAVIRVLETDPGHPYWFLYEGPAGGKWDIPNTYWGTNEGKREELPDFYRNEELFEHWHWAFFGHREVDRVLFAVHLEPDDLYDTMGFLGNTPGGIDSSDGMVVFGFGRGPGTSPLMTTPNTFIIGFFEQKVTDVEAFRQLEKHVGGLVSGVIEKSRTGK